MKNEVKIKDEWTQEELLKNTKLLKADGIEVVLVDTILKPLKGIDTEVYNPFELIKKPKGTYFVFYCDTGKNSKERLDFYKNRFKDYICISLRGGRGYWRPNFQLLDSKND